jgi:hypothetical protein
MVYKDFLNSTIFSLIYELTAFNYFVFIFVYLLFMSLTTEEDL